MAGRRRVQINPRMQRLFRRLPAEMTQESKTEILQQAEILAAEMRWRLIQHGAVDTGELLRSIDVKVGSRGLSAEVGPGLDKMGDMGRDQMVGKFVEYGTRRGIKGGRYKTAKGRNRLIYRSHPGVTDRPFVRPSFESRREDMIAALSAARDRVLAKVTK